MTVTGFLRISIIEYRNFTYLCMMEYNDYRTHLKICEFLGKEPIGQYKKIHDYLTELWDGMGIVVDSKSNMFVFQKEGDWFFEQDLKNGCLWCQNVKVWSFFRDDMGMELTEIQDFIKSTVEEHLKCKVGTPLSLRWCRASAVEEHLKCKVGTPGLAGESAISGWKNI